MASVITSKDCFFKGARYRKNDQLEYTGTKKDMPKYFDEIKKESKKAEKDS